MFIYFSEFFFHFSEKYNNLWEFMFSLFLPFLALTILEEMNQFVSKYSYVF